MDALLNFAWPILAGGASWWFASKCRGRNAQKAFRYAAWGFWMLLLIHVPLLLVGLPFLDLPLLCLIKFVPAVLLFLAAGNSMLKEMRAQQRGDYTEKAL